MGSKDITITCISLLTGLKSSEVKTLTVVPIGCLLARLHLSKPWHLLLRLFLWQQCQTRGLVFVLVPPQPSQNNPYGHTTGQAASLKCHAHWHLYKLLPSISLLGRWNTSTCFYMSASLLQGEASLWARKKPQQYQPCIQSIHWKR